MARNLLDLSGSPPGLYIDEASIGYNAWSVAHFAADEHGVHLPLYFQAFGEFKNPVYIYALAGLLRLLPLTPAVERAPAAILGLVTVLFLTLAAWRLTRSRAVVLASLVLAGTAPWLTQESRVGFEVIAMVAALSGALWALAGTRGGHPGRWFGTAGVFLTVAIFAYTTGRLEVLLYTGAFALAFAWRGPRPPKWWLTLVPVLAGYGVLAVWSLANPNALTSRFAALSIAADGASLPRVALRFLANYGQYMSPDFLFVHGDLNPRHNTGFAGMLPWAVAPLLLAGLVVCWRRRAEPMPRFVILCLVLGPFAAALTQNGGEPHALRSACMLPFWIALAIYGAAGAADWAGGRTVRQLVTVGAVVLGLLAQGALYTRDMFSAYPARSAAAFDTGEEPAAILAHDAAAGHTVFLSSSLDEPYIEAFFGLRPEPPAQPVAEASAIGLAKLRMRIVDPQSAAGLARPGDVLVLASGDEVPASATRIATEPYGLVMVYRAGG